MKTAVKNWQRKTTIRGIDPDLMDELKIALINEHKRTGERINQGEFVNQAISEKLSRIK